MDPSIQKRKENTKNLRVSAFELRPQLATTRNFTNKFGEYKMM